MHNLHTSETHPKPPQIHDKSVVTSTPTDRSPDETVYVHDPSGVLVVVNGAGVGVVGRGVGAWVGVGVAVGRLVVGFGDVGA